MKKVLAVILLLFIPISAFASPSMDDFKTLPVLHEGRVEPLDSFARYYLKEFSGKQKTDELSASEWLVEMFFDPTMAIERPVFQLENRQISFVELSPMLAKTIPQLGMILGKKQSGEKLNNNEGNLLALHEKALTFLQILRSFSFALPLDISLPENDFIKGSPRFYELLALRKQIESKEITNQLVLFRQVGEQSVLVKIVPDVWAENGKAWKSPWAVFGEGAGAPQTKQLYDLWISLLKSYEQKDEQKWQSALTGLHSEYSQLRPNQVRPLALKIEAVYNAVRPVLVIAILYVLTALCFLLYYSTQKPKLLRAGFFLFCVSVICHASLMVARVYILQRAPVGTLYESVLFVPLILSLAGLIIYKARNSETVLFLSALLSAFLMGMSVPYSLNENTFAPLSAVLNTDFWLGTHVVFITAGYAWCLLASAMAQYEIASCSSKSFPKTLKIVLVAALFFTTIGTALGGIWADQSWGRFWGWDPKENGALFIVLWLVWILHALVSGHLKTMSALVLTSVLSIVVAIAWFGVNLLNIGLHAYGFTSGIVWALTLFVCIQGALIGILTLRARKKCQQI